MSDPTLLTFTVMKSEGPFILEWVALQRLMGVDHILVFTNDCYDRTDPIRDGLERIGLVRHLLNPIAVLPKGSNLRKQQHLKGVGYAQQKQLSQEASHVFLSDVGAFPRLRDGNTARKTLLDRLAWPGAGTMAPIIFGTGEVLAFEERLVTHRYTRGSSVKPGGRRSRRGFKSISRVGARRAMRNHRPLTDPAVVPSHKWLDGSRRDFPMDLRYLHQKDTDARGMFGPITLNRCTRRALESFPVKQVLSDAVADGRIDQTCFRRQNQVIASNAEMLNRGTRPEEEVAGLTTNTRLADLRTTVAETYGAKFGELREAPAYGAPLNLAGLAPADG